MMRRIFWLVLVIGLSSSFAYATAGEKVYGEGVSGNEVTAISKILEDPEAFKGKVVRVRGKVKDVCKNMGCWMDIEDSTGKIQIKVEDGVIVFPTSAVGKESIAEGRVEVRSLSKEQYTQWLKHVAEEQGREFDPASVGEGPYEMIRVRGTGAVIGEE
jgi:hypothetical protein